MWDWCLRKNPAAAVDSWVISANSGGSGASHSAQRPGLAATVHTPSDAPRTRNRQGGDGTQIGRPSLLDVAEECDYQQVKWITKIMIGRPAPSKREFEEVIMIEGFCNIYPDWNA
jgi:hypothetical protein